MSEREHRAQRDERDLVTTTTGSGSGARVLLRFDLSSLPAGATVQSASLTLYVTSRSNSNSLTAAVYPVLRSWHAGYATWASADGSIAWTAAGCNGVGTDRSGTAAASVTFASASGSVTTPDLTALVQGWVSDPGSNQGLLLRPQGGAGSVNYALASAQNTTVAYRPKLTVTYTTGGGSGATATPTPTPTATVTGPTSTPTATATTPSGSGTTLTFQQGASGYSGATDTYLNRWAATTNYNNSATVLLRYTGNATTPDDDSGLLRFDLSSLPPGATIQSASLTLYVTSRSNSNSLTAAVYPVLRAWNAGYATWASADGSVNWTAAGCNGVGTDRSGTAAASVTFAIASGSVTTPDLTAPVQGWVSDPNSNQGLLLRPEGGTGVVNYSLASAQHATVAYRPKLTVTYSAGGTLMQAEIRSQEPGVRDQGTVAQPQAPAVATVVTKYYAIGGQRVAMRQDGVLYYLIGDHLGSTSVTYRVSDGQVVTQHYKPYGEPRAPAPSTLPTDYRFTGQRSEEAALGSLYDFGARFYSPSLGRFLSPDTFVPQPGDPQSLNRYSYALNNPLRYTDPSGHFPATPLPFPDQWLVQLGQWLEQAWQSLTVQAAPIVVPLTQYGPQLVQFAQGADAASRASGEAGRFGNPNWDPNDGQKREQSVRDMLSSRYQQSFGTSDAEIRTNLGMQGKTADFVGYNSGNGRWLIAESKGGDMYKAVDQLQNTMRGLLNKTGFQPVDIDLRIYTDAGNFQRLLTDPKGLAGYQVRNGFLGYVTEAGEWIWEMVNGVRVSVQVYP